MSNTKCPCCGKELDDAVAATALDAVALPNSQRKLLDALVSRFPRTVPTFAQVDAVWGDRPDGGPDGNLPKHLAVLAHRINKRIAPLGWRVRGVNGRSLPGRSLVRIPMVKETLTSSVEAASS
jgi:hypothetical protein